MFKVWFRITISFFLVVCIFQITYDSLVYASYAKRHSCDVLITDFGLNEFVWILSR